MLHVLVIEDNPSDVMLIREAMRRSEVAADVTIASNGEEGLALIQESHFDMVFLDLNLPRLHGHAVLARRYQENAPPIYVFSGSKNPKDREAALAQR